MTGNSTLAKPRLRAQLQAARRAHVAALPAAAQALILLRPPAPVASLTAGAGTIGLYAASPHEAPTRSYAKWFYVNGQSIALPWFAGRDAPMMFRHWPNPYDDDALEPGPWGALQPRLEAPDAEPEVVFVPLVGFTAQGQRLGRGGGHYDRWLAAHPQVAALGLAWDCQLVEALPTEPHDRPLRAIVTPTRVYGEIG